MCSLLTRKLFSTTKYLYKSSLPSTIINKNIKLSRIKPVRLFADNNDHKIEDEISENDNKQSSNLEADIKAGHKVFRDEDSEIIFDVEEEMRKIDFEKITQLEQETDPFIGINLKHGVHGVYDIEDLVDLLRKEKAKDIFVASVPKEIGYVDYVVVVTGRSVRHMSALMTLVRKVYKLKRYETDIIPKIEGEKCKDWMALDLNNIVLHMFSTQAREDYDLETLWAIGSKYDKRPDGELKLSAEFEEKYKQFLDSLQPADATQPLNVKSI
ncbi:uncharacterized protein LOC103569335 [Microplitis demolitor]|uniref:uncharacterized protein LOC103569335 n=1 Tax=Microplitis demolitor TaxID=69319 RepID=UPI0004CCE4BF|nr:uncharacterized protein LOC103569335 [Microplitis demolitor]